VAEVLKETADLLGHRFLGLGDVHLLGLYTGLLKHDTQFVLDSLVVQLLI
jgi:hypothetical protein